MPTEFKTPWEWEQDTANSLLIRDASGRKVAEIIAENELEDIDGEHARLIAAAPELLAALKAIAEEDDENDEWEGTEKFSKVREIARAVVTKATGV